MNNQLDKLRHNFFEIVKSILENIDIENIDDILDNRDNDEFSELWTNSYNQIKKISLESEVKEKISEARKEIFILTYQKTNSSDLSAYISDDFDLICLQYLSETDNEWVNKLYATYLNREIPQGILKNISLNMNDLINKN